MKKILAIGLLLLILSAAVAGCMGYEPDPMPEPTTIPATTEETHAVTLEPMDGYTMLQTVYLMTARNDCAASELVEILNSSGLYYTDTKLPHAWYFTIADAAPVSEQYGAKVFEGDSIEISMESDEQRNYWMESNDYYFHEKNVKSVYTYDRGYSDAAAATATEEIWFVNNNEKSAYSYSGCECETVQQSLDMGIAFEK